MFALSAAVGLSARHALVGLPLALLLAAIWTGCVAARQEGEARPETGAHVMHELHHGGLARTYSLYLPRKYDPGRKYPLVLALHGGGGNAAKWPAYTNSCFERLADRDGFILVYPEGIEGQWNDGRQVESFRAQREDIDDVGFLSSLIDHLAGAYPVDRNRIYLLGASNGGMMAGYAGAVLADKVAAIATVIASLPENLVGRLHPSSPLSVLMINGTEDPLVQWQGGVVKFGRRENGRVISVQKTVDFWVRAIKADSTPTTVDLPPVAADDDTRVTRSVYGGGEGGNEVVLYTVRGGGHTWPAREDTRGALLRLVVDKAVGKKSRQIDSCQLIWDFFGKHPKKGGGGQGAP